MFLTQLSNAQEANAVVIEACSISPRMDTSARPGARNIHINIQGHQADIRNLALPITIAETQMVRKPFGATLLIRTKDGAIVNQLRKNVQEVNAKAIEDFSLKQSLVKPARLGTGNTHTNTHILQADIQKVT